MNPQTAQQLQYLRPVHARQHEIENNQVKCIFLNALGRQLAIRQPFNGMPLATQPRSNRRSQVDSVLD
jgi:hypothetical protein